MARYALAAAASFALVATAWLAVDAGAADSLLRGRVDGPGSSSRRLETDKATQNDPEQQAVSYLGTALFQLLYGVIYFCCIVSRYPEHTGEPTDEARETQGKNEVTAFLMCENSFMINLTSCICPAARAAHTYDKTGLANYWVGLCFSAFCPCLTLFYMNACTDLNEKLGGERRNCLMSAVCAFCCSCCVIAQDGQSLDECTGATVGCCGVEYEGGDHGYE